jgi:RNA polymerase sigma factor (sigma-70 family)
MATYKKNYRNKTTRQLVTTYREGIKKTEKHKRYMNEYFSASELSGRQRMAYEQWYFSNEVPLSDATNGVAITADSFIPSERDTAELEEFERQQELLIKLLNKALKELTPHQSEIYQLTIQGLTQTQIAEKLQVGQSSISLAWNGSVSVSSSGRKIMCGGIKHKLYRLIIKDLVALNEEAILERFKITKKED